MICGHDLDGPMEWDQFVGDFEPKMGAEFSADRTHRLLLWRIWDPTTKPLGFVMLNPSSADETRDDPTTVRNMVRARRAGYGGVVQANLYSFRTPSPAVLKKAGYPGGPRGDNAQALHRLAAACLDVVMACGAHARLVDFEQACLELAGARRPPRLFHLGLLKNGMPRHPLHTAYGAAPTWGLQEWP